MKLAYPQEGHREAQRGVVGGLDEGVHRAEVAGQDVAQGLGRFEGEFFFHFVVCQIWDVKRARTKIHPLASGFFESYLYYSADVG